MYVSDCTFNSLSNAHWVKMCMEIMGFFQKQFEFQTLESGVDSYHDHFICNVSVLLFFFSNTLRKQHLYLAKIQYIPIMLLFLCIFSNGIFL